MRERPGNFPAVDDLGGRLSAVRERISEAARRVGRDPAEVTLVVVTKVHPAERVARLFELGHEVVAENRVQEFAAKYEELGGRGEWHFIGHLQRNKVAQVVGRAALIQSVDSVRLIEEIEKRAEQKGVVQRVLIEVNVGEEEQKTGAMPGEVPGLIEALGSCAHVRAEGLMAMAPYAEDPEEARPYFRRLRELMAGLGEAANFTPRHLSMGMSGDFEVAIEEGSTMVRVGTAVMGERPYH